MSDTAERDKIGAPAARLGGELRARRQSLGWELPDLAQSLRIRQSYLEAIEAGRMNELPGTTYALGFVRAYASALGLSGEQIASRFRAESAEANIKPALSFPAPVPQRGVPAGALMLLGLLILGGTYAAWYYVSEHQRTLPETVPPIPDRLLPAAEKPTPSPQVASILPTASPPASGPAPGPEIGPGSDAEAGRTAATGGSAVTVKPGGQVGGAAPTSVPRANGMAQTARSLPGGQGSSGAAAVPAAVVAAQPSPASPGVSGSRVSVGQASSGTASPGLAVGGSAAGRSAPLGSRILIRTNGDAWVTIKQPNGPPLLNKLMHAGDTYALPLSAVGATLTTGNAGSTALDVDGTAIPNLGGSGAVRRDLKLDADALKSGPLPPIPHGHLRSSVAATPD